MLSLAEVELDLGKSEDARRPGLISDNIHDDDRER